MADYICGSTDTGSGEPCQRVAGWGTDEDSGPCRDHLTDEVQPRKLSKQRQEFIATAIEEGHSFRSACEASGISKDTGHRWMRLGEEQDEGPLSDFYDRITRARGVGKRTIERSIVEICNDRGDARTLLRYLQHIEAGHAAAEDDELAGLNLIVPEGAIRNES